MSKRNIFENKWRVNGTINLFSSIFASFRVPHTGYEKKLILYIDHVSRNVHHRGSDAANVVVYYVSPEKKSQTVR